MRRGRGNLLHFLTALLLALALWSFVSFTTDPSTELPQTVAVTPINLSAGLMAVDQQTNLPSPLTREVSFRAFGPLTVMERLNVDSFQASVDLGGLTPGVHDLPIKVDPPVDVHVRDLRPLTITVKLDELAQREAPVIVTRQGQPPALYAIGLMRQSAQTVTASGPATLLENVISATGSVSIQNQTTDLDTTVTLQPVDRRGNIVRGITLTPAQVNVRIPITPRVQARQVAVVPNIIGSPAPGYTWRGGLDWNPKTVNILASSDVSGTLTTEPISLDDLTASITRTVRLRTEANVITFPSDIRITVTVTIDPIAVQSQVPYFAGITPINADPALDVDLPATTLAVTLAGSYEQLINLQPADVAATVDLRGLGPGTYTLPVTLNIPPGLQLVAPLLPEVAVTLTARPTPTPEPTPSPTPEATLTPTVEVTATPP